MKTTAMGIPVKARRIQRQRRYSDVAVFQLDEHGMIVHARTVAAERPKSCGPKWEPEITPKARAA
jgi:hypothetical protein